MYNRKIKQIAFILFIGKQALFTIKICHPAKVNVRNLNIQLLLYKFFFPIPVVSELMNKISMSDNTCLEKYLLYKKSETQSGLNQLLVQE